MGEEERREHYKWACQHALSTSYTSTERSSIGVQERELLWKNYQMVRTLAYLEIMSSILGTASALYSAAPGRRRHKSTSVIQFAAIRGVLQYLTANYHPAGQILHANLR